MSTTFSELDLPEDWVDPDAQTAAQFLSLNTDKSRRQSKRRPYIRSKVRRAWMGMRARCNNPNHTNYPYYGARGIKVLFSSFEEFYAEVGDPPTCLHTIDRINNDGNYEKGNVRWATRSQQNENRRKYRWRRRYA